jgi:hypothetical protein
MKTASSQAFAENVDLLRVASILAWLGEGYLLFSLWSAGHAPSGVSFSKGLAPIAHLLPWISGMAAWRNVTRAANVGTLDATGSEKCQAIIGHLLTAAYGALSVIEMSFL